MLKNWTNPKGLLTGREQFIADVAVRSDRDRFVTTAVDRDDNGEYFAHSRTACGTTFYLCRDEIWRQSPA